MKSAGPWTEALPLSSDDSDADSKDDHGIGSTKTSSKFLVLHSVKDVTSEEVATDPRSSMGPPQQEPQKCPRCDSFNTRFCYYANKNPSQPRYHCKSCRRYWTSGGIIRDIPIGGGSRKSNPSKFQPSSNTNTNSTRSTSNSVNCIDAPLGPPFMVTNFNPLVGNSNITNSTKSTSNSGNHIDPPLGPPFTVTKFNPVVEIGSSTSLMTMPNSMVLEYNFGNLTAMQKTLDVQQENQQQQLMTVGKIDMKELTAELENMVSLLLEEVGEVHSNSELLALDLCSNGSQGLSGQCQLGAVIRRAEMYQEYMKQIPIPPHRGSLIPFTTWQGLAKSVKKLYGQPLHYLTNILLKQWDELRIGTYDEHQPLDTIIHPCKAEATIWLIEEVHRLASSHYHLATLWASDPMHHTSVDPIFPQI